MAKIKFETGQTVNFEGTPTQQDIEEVAQNLGISKIQPKSALGKVGEFLAPTITKTIGKIRKGEKVTGREALGAGLEAASFAVPARAITRGIGVAARVAKPLTQRLLARAGVGAATLGLAEAGRAVGEGEEAGEVLKRTLGAAVIGIPFGVAAPVVFKGAGKVVGGIKRVITGEKFPEQSARIMTGVARISKGKQEKFRQLSKGEDVGQYLTKRGIFGTMEDVVDQTYKRFQQSKTAVDEAFAKLPGTFREKPVKTMLKDLFKRETKISTPGAQSKDLARVKELNRKYIKQGLDMTETNEVKRLYERNVKLDYVKQNLPMSVARANTVDNAVRNWQRSKAKELGFKNVENLNRETQLAKRLVDDIGLEHTGLKGNNMITLTDWIILAGGDPTAIGAFLSKKVLLSQAARAKFARILAPKPTIGTPRANIRIKGGKVKGLLPRLREEKLKSKLK